MEDDWQIVKRHVLFGIWIAAGLAIAVGCTSEDPVASPNALAPAVTSATKSVGPAGGVVAVSDGTSVEIPAGALPTETVITIEADAAERTLAGVLIAGRSYTFGPESLTFMKPVKVKIAYVASKIPAGKTTDDLVVLSVPGTASYVELQPSWAEGNRVNAETTRLSTFVAGIVGCSCEDAGGPSTCGCADAGAPSDAAPRDATPDVSLDAPSKG